MISLVIFDLTNKCLRLGFPNRVFRTRFHRVVFNDWGTSCPCLLPPLAVKSKPPAMRVVVDSARLKNRAHPRSAVSEAEMMFQAAIISKIHHKRSPKACQGSTPSAGTRRLLKTKSGVRFWTIGSSREMMFCLLLGFLIRQ